MTPYDGRFGRSTFGNAVAGFVCFDLVVHRWDLGRAAGVAVELDPRDVEQVQGVVDQMGQVMRDNGALGAAVPAPADATPQERLLADLGRSA